MFLKQLVLLQLNMLNRGRLWQWKVLFLCISLFPTCGSIFPMNLISSAVKMAHDGIKTTLLPDSSDVEYLFYDPDKSSEYDEFIPMSHDGTVPIGLWNHQGAVKVLVHGLTYPPIEDLESENMLPLARAYKAYNQSLNIIVVNWMMYSTRVIYPLAASNTKKVGLWLAQFLVSLKTRNAFQSWDMVHLLGFSMGGHVVGIAGYHIQKMTGGKKIGRITGLDPAGPNFDMPGGLSPSDLTHFLDKSDAKFVDVIHCSMGTPLHWTTALLLSTFGSIVQAGHADFYPNGGYKQWLQCNPLEDKIACSHKACIILYMDALTHPMKACPCSNWSNFTEGKCNCEVEFGNGEYIGDRCRASASGKYYLLVTKNIDARTLLKGFISGIKHLLS